MRAAAVRQAASTRAVISRLLLRVARAAPCTDEEQAPDDSIDFALPETAAAAAHRAHGSVLIRHLV